MGNFPLLFKSPRLLPGIFWAVKRYSAVVSENGKGIARAVRDLIV